MTQLQSLPPAFVSPPHVTDPSGAIAAWFTDPPGVVLQLTRPVRGTTPMARWMTGPGYDLVTLRMGGNARDLRMVLDMRLMTGRSATARALLLQHAKSVIDQVGHLVLIPSVQLGPAYVSVVEASAKLLRLAGMNVDLEHSLEQVLDRYGIRAARPTEGAASRATAQLDRRV